MLCLAVAHVYANTHKHQAHDVCLASLCGMRCTGCPAYCEGVAENASSCLFAPDTGSQMLVRLMFGEDATDRKRAALAELADHRFTGKYVDNFTVMPGGVGFEIILRHAQA